MKVLYITKGHLDPWEPTKVVSHSKVDVFLERVFLDLPERLLSSDHTRPLRLSQSSARLSETRKFEYCILVFFLPLEYSFKGPFFHKQQDIASVRRDFCSNVFIYDQYFSNNSQTSQAFSTRVVGVPSFFPKGIGALFVKINTFEV